MDDLLKPYEEHARIIATICAMCGQPFTAKAIEDAVLTYMGERLKGQAMVDLHVRTVGFYADECSRIAKENLHREMYPEAPAGCIPGPPGARGFSRLGGGSDC